MSVATPEGPAIELFAAAADLRVPSAPRNPMLVLFLLACPHDRKPDADDTAAVDIPEDNIANVLGDCDGTKANPGAYPNQLSEGNELQLYRLAEPEAVCNDGSRAGLYVRAATDPELAGVWSIHVQGGGACFGYEDCKARYCGSAYYDASKMSSEYLPDAVGAVGIYDADPANAYAGANQVFIYYCSSDEWAGQGSRTVSAAGEPTFTQFERGHVILTAGIDELLGGITAEGGEVMPKLSEAELVIFSGTSAGSHGAMAHADWLSARLAENGTVTRAIFDAAHSPPRESFAPDYVAAYDEVFELLVATQLEGADYTPWVDESCARLASGPAGCADHSITLANHITTPFFVRQDLRDTTSLAQYLAIPSDIYEEMSAGWLAALPDAPASAAETLDFVPAVYGPNCNQHVALESSGWWRESTVEDDAGAAFTFQDAVLAWQAGDTVALVDAAVAGDENGPRSVCVAVEGER